MFLPTLERQDTPIKPESYVLDFVKRISHLSHLLIYEKLDIGDTGFIYSLDIS